MSHTIRGSSSECLAHYLGHLPSPLSQEGAAARNPIIQYCRCKRRTISAWIKGQPPVGEYQVRVRYFLAAQGYVVNELENLHPLVWQLGLLLAYDVLSTEDIRRELGYKNSQDVYTMLFGRQRPLQLEQRLSPIVEKYRDTLTARGLKLSKNGLGFDFGNAPSSNAEAPVGRKPAAMTGPRTAVDQKASMIKALASMIQGALPLARAMEHDPFTSSDRDILHQLLPNNEVFHLVYSLKRLSSETAHQQIPPQSPKR